jgi:hypothetical protein
VPVVFSAWASRARTTARVRAKSINVNLTECDGMASSLVRCNLRRQPPPPCGSAWRMANHASIGISHRRLQWVFFSRAVNPPSRGQVEIITGGTLTSWLQTPKKRARSREPHRSSRSIKPPDTGCMNDGPNSSHCRGLRSPATANFSRLYFATQSQPSS